MHLPKAEYYERIGVPVHEGTITDSDGNPVTGDAGVALKKIRKGETALTALVGYKGYGFALIVEPLSSLLLINQIKSNKIRFKSNNYGC